ncbi:MAG: thioredoxin [Planctomycetota bacterium]
MAGVVHVSDKDFEAEVLQSDILVLADFSAEWCGPCKALAPMIEEIASEQAGKVKVCKIDVDKSQQTAVKYGITSVPTVIFFKKGEAVETLVGMRPKAAYESVIAAQAD